MFFLLISLLLEDFLLINILRTNFLPINILLINLPPINFLPQSRITLLLSSLESNTPSPLFRCLDDILLERYKESDGEEEDDEDAGEAEEEEEVMEIEDAPKIVFSSKETTTLAQSDKGFLSPNILF